MTAQVGRRSRRSLADAAGLNSNAISDIEKKGRAEPETYMALAKALEIRVVDLFVMQEWIPKEEVSPPPLTPNQKEAVALYDEAERKGRGPLYLAHSRVDAEYEDRGGQPSPAAS